MIKTRSDLFGEGGCSQCPPGCSATPCYQIGLGHFPWRGAANLEKAVKLEQCVQRSGFSKLQSVPGIIGFGCLLPFVREQECLLACTATDVANNPKRSKSLLA